MDDNLLTVSDVHFSIGAKKILAGVHFSLHRGAMVGVLGPNGSGKTTLLRLLCRYWRPQQGSLAYCGRDYRHYTLGQLSKILSYLPQNLPEGLPMSVEDFLLLGLDPTIRQRTLLKTDWERFEQLLGQFELGEIRHRRVGDLSAGESRRVFIAGGLMSDPELYLLDEPNNGLDWRHHESVFRQLKDYQQVRGATLIMTLHDLNLAARLCDVILLLRSDGTLQSVGPTPQVMTLENLGSVYQVNFKRVTSDDGTEEWFLH